MKMKKMPNGLEKFKLENVIEEIRSLLLKDITEDDNLVDIEWIIRILLMSDQRFKNVREVDTFLSNMTGLEHNTKSTGRDRIINWYLSNLHEMDLHEQNRILFRISRYLFITTSSDYYGWKRTLKKKKKSLHKRSIECNGER